MNQEGPDLNYLLHKLSECPTDFQKEPCILKTGEKPSKLPDNSINTIALVSDLLYGITKVPLSSKEIEDIRTSDAINSVSKPAQISNFLKLIQICCYILYENSFQKPEYVSLIKKFLSFKKDSKLYLLSKLVEPTQFITDPERREELCRTCLQHLNLRPKGETDIQAKDRLTTIDTVERQRVFEESKKSAQRAKKIREEMERKEAEEAASKYNRE